MAARSRRRPALIPPASPSEGNAGPFVASPSVERATLGLTAGATGVKPWAVGHTFVQGHLPSGQALDGVQTTVKTTWPDGSAKVAVLAGVTSFVSTTASISIGAGTQPSGTALSTASLKATGITAAVDAGAFGSASWAGTDWDTPHETWVSGPVMSSWIFRKQVGADAHLVAWIEVRLWSTGAVEVLPWVENGFITSAGANKSATYTFTLGGSQRFSAVVDVKHHTRVPLLSGALSYWLGTDPAVVASHDAAYMMASKMVPNYGFGAPSAGALNALQQSYTPNTLAGISSAMGAAGSSASIIPAPGALYVSSDGDARAWRAAQVFGYSGGSWSTHYRDPSGNAIARFGSYPSASLQGGSPTIAAGSGGENGTPVTTHQPSYGYMPFLMTGRKWFLDEQLSWAMWNYLNSRVNSRRGETDYETAPFLFASGAAGVIDARNGAYANRGAHWSVRTLAQALAICPPGLSHQADLVAAFEANTDFYVQVYVDGTHAPGWVSPQGFLGDYSADGSTAYTPTNASTAWYGAAWMSAFGVQAWGFASDIGLPISAGAQADHLAVRNHAYKQVVSRTSDGSGGGWNWRRFGVYAYPIGSDAAGLPPDAWFTSAQSYSEYRSGYGLADIPATAGLSLKSHSSDTDMVLGDTTSSDYGQFALGALAYAVDHGAPGAVDGWLRISGASNFSALSGYAVDDPSHGFYPRASLSATPAWASGQAVNEWRELSNTALSAQPVMAAPNGGTAPQGKQDAWCGWHAKPATSEVFSVGQGGHDDYHGDEVNRINFAADAPAWSQLVAPLAPPAGNGDYNNAGRPSSRHGYHTAVYSAQLDRALLMPGAARSTDGFATSTIAAFNVATGTYDSAATWSGSGMPVAAGTGPCSYAIDPATGNVYAWINNAAVLRWNSGLPGSWTTLISNPSNPAANYTAAAFDTTRNQVLFLGGGLGGNMRRRYDVAGNSEATITLTGTDISTSDGLGLVYCETTDRYYACVPGNGAAQVYVITPNSGTSWACALLSTTGTAPSADTSSNSAYAPFTKFQYLPALGMLVFSPRWGMNVFALRIH